MKYKCPCCGYYTFKSPLDYEAFEKIDSGVDYLNPRHFSMYEFTKYINKI